MKKELEEIQKIELDNCVVEINKAKDNIEQSIIKIGQWLTTAKNLMKHGKWEDWLELNVGYTKMTASRYMKAYNLINTVPKEIEDKVEKLGGTKIIELSTLKTEQVKDIVVNNDVENMSVRELKEIVKGFKKSNKESKSNIDVTFENDTKEIIGTPKELMQLEESVDTEKVLLDTIVLNTELRNRTDSDETITITLVARFEAKEITFKEINAVIIKEKYDLPIFFNQKLFEEYIGDKCNHDLYSDYQKYDCNMDKKDDRTYYSIFDRDLEWQEAIKCWDEEDEGAIDWNKNNNVDNNTYQLIKTYLDTTKYLCVYKDYKLKGTFIDGKLDDVQQLCKYDSNLNYDILEALYNKLELQMTSYEKRQEKRDETDRIARELRQQKQKRYEEAYNLWKTSYQPYSMGKYKFEDIWDEYGEINNYKLWRELCDFVDSQRKTQQDRWKDYDFGGMFGSGSITVKEEDKSTYKQFYRKLAMEFHPDKLGGDTKAMQLVNELKKNWGI